MKRSKKEKLAAEVAGVRERVRGLAELPASRIEYAAKNFRTHDDYQRDVMRGLHKEIGAISGPVVWVPDDAAREALRVVPRGDARAFAAWLDAYTGPVRLIDGALRKSLREGQVIQVQITDLDEQEAAKALATFDAVSDLAGKDAAMLESLLMEIGTPEEKGTVDLFTELKKHIPITARNADNDEEEPVIPTDALVKKWGTAPGQLWVVPSLTVPGREHRLLCGDCRDPANVERLHEGARPDLGLHDPPYGIGLVKDGKTYGHAKTPARRTDFAPIEGDKEPFDPTHLLSSGKGLALWGGNHFADKLPPSPAIVVWDKRCEMEKTTTFSEGEIAWLSPHMGKRLRFIRHLWDGMLRASERGEQRLHPTQKPVVVQRQIVEWYTEPGDLVADWYMGAGAVIIACEQTGRIGHGMDIAHAYLAATLERLSARGLQPRLVQ